MESSELENLLNSAAFEDGQESTQEQVQQRTEIATKLLQDFRDTLSQNEQDALAKAKLIGNATRNAAWRVPFGNSGLVTFFLDILASEDKPEQFHIQAIRVIGNSCAYVNENREKVSSDPNFAALIASLGKETLAPYASPALMNVLLDYDAAQKRASEAGASRKIIDILRSPQWRAWLPAIGHLSEVLGMLMLVEGDTDRVSTDAPLILFQRATELDSVDNFCSLASVGMAYLKFEKFQEAFVPEAKVLLQSMEVAHAFREENGEADSESAEALKEAKKNLLETVADITGLDAYAKMHSVESSQTTWMASWLGHKAPPLQTAACIVLGNLARGDATAIQLLKNKAVGNGLRNIISDTSLQDRQLLALALGLAKNLSIPQENKTELSSYLSPDVLGRLFVLDVMPVVQFKSVQLARLLLVSHPDNVRKLCQPLPEHSGIEQHTLAAALLALFQRTDDENLRFEISRCVLNICRVLYSKSAAPLLPEWGNAAYGDGADETLDQRRRFFAEHDIQGPVKFVVTQEKWPTLRSDAWFACATMSRFKDGTDLVLPLLVDEAVVKALGDTIKVPEGENILTEGLDTTEQTGAGLEPSMPSLGTQLSGVADEEERQRMQQALIARMDRENVTVLLQGTLEHTGDGLTGEQKSVLEDLMKKGAELARRMRGIDLHSDK